MGLPMVAMPFVGGWLADKYGYNIPFAVGIALSFASAFMFAKMCVEPRKTMPRDTVS
jgi:MFS family permease